MIASALVRKLKRVCAHILRRGSCRYEPGTFWERRHARYGDDLRAVANDLDGEADRYDEQKRQFFAFLADVGIALRNKTCLEFGCGTGFWGEVLLEAGAAAYTGVDISESSVHLCRGKLPGSRFFCTDVSTTAFEPERPVDVLISIDVTQHVVEEQKLARFLANAAAGAKPGGYIILTSYTGSGDRYADPESEVVVARVLRMKKLRWVHMWDTPTIGEYLTECELVASRDFWDKTILAYWKRR